MDKLTYIGYVRKSSESDDRQVQSIETQTTILTEYAEKYGLNLVDIIPEARSAKDDGNRPMFDSLVSRLKSGEADAILVAHLDRLARNGVEAGLLDKLLSTGVIQEIRTPMRPYTADDDLSLGIELLFASNYSKNLSRRVKEGIQTKLRRGEYYRSAPLGYLNRDAKIYPDPERASLITELFEMYTSGNYSLRQITKYINERGLRTKPHRKRIVLAVVQRILTDPTYYGVIPHKGTLYPGIHQPLISKNVFDTVQDVLTGKKVCGKTPRYFLYRDFLTCAECGCKLTADIKKGKYIYYYCTNGKGNCSQHKKYLQESITESLVSQLFNDFALPAETATASLSQYIQESKQHITTQTSIYDSLLKELSIQEAKLTKIEDAYFDGLLTKERYQQRKTDTVNEITNLKTELKNLKPEQNPDFTFELMEEYKNQAVNIYEIFVNGKDEVKREVMLSALSNCEIRDGKIVKTRYKKPFSYFEGLSKTSDLAIWRRRWDSNPRIPDGI